MRDQNKLFHRLRYDLLITLVAVVLLSVPLPGLAQVSKQVDAATGQGPETETVNLGIEACIYGYPLVIMEILRSVMTNVAAPEGFHAPLGQFAHVRQYPDASFRGTRRFSTRTSSIPSPGWTSRKSLTS